jgi:hypothetical protein
MNGDRFTHAIWIASLTILLAILALFSAVAGKGHAHEAHSVMKYQATSVTTAPR